MSALWIGITRTNMNSVTNFSTNVTESFRCDAMLRQIAISVKINRDDQNSLINNKTEWNFVKIPGKVVL